MFIQTSIFGSLIFHYIHQPLSLPPTKCLPHSIPHPQGKILFFLWLILSFFQFCFWPSQLTFSLQSVPVAGGAFIREGHALNQSFLFGSPKQVLLSDMLGLRSLSASHWVESGLSFLTFGLPLSCMSLVIWSDSVLSLLLKQCWWGLIVYLGEGQLFIVIA